MIRPRPNKAFTLLEVILAIGLVLIVVGGGMHFYRFAAKTRQDVLADVQFYRTARLVMDRLTAELQCIRADSMLQPMLTWTDSRLQFTTATAPGFSAWAAADWQDGSVPPTHDMRLLTYEVQVAEDEYGDVVNHGLRRTAHTVLEIPDSETGQGVDETTAVSVETAAPVKFVRFRYFTGDDLADEGEVAGGITDAGWVEQWQRRELPGAVEITLGARAKDDGEDIDAYLGSHETFRRVVFLPGSGIRAHAGFEE